MGGDESGALVSLLLLVMSDFVTPMDCSPPGSSVHGILQARIPEYSTYSCIHAMPFSRGSSQPSDQTCVCCIAGEFFTAEHEGDPL